MDEYLKEKDEPFNKLEDEIITRLDLRDAIAELPEELKNILALWLYDYNQGETAKICEQSRTSIWLKRKKIIATLRRHLGVTV